MEDGRNRRMEQTTPGRRKTASWPSAVDGAGDASLPGMRAEKEQRTFGESDFCFENYENDRLELLPRDWTTLYAYWSITEERKRMVERYCNRKWEQVPKVLRIYDVNDIPFSEGGRAADWWDVELAGGSSHGFVGGMKSDCAYCMDYGIRLKDGSFAAILRSNCVRLPSRSAEANMPETAKGKEKAGRSHREEMARTENAAAFGSRTIPDWLKRFTGYSLQEG